MTIRNRTVRAVAVPPSPMAERTLSRVDYADAFAVALAPGAPRDPEALADRVFRSPPAWVLAAMKARNALVRRIGLKAPESTKAGFPLLDRDEREVVLGLDDRHLDFRASIVVEGDTAIVATRVHLRNALGRAYFAPVRLAHPFVVKAMMRRLLTPDPPILAAPRHRGSPPDADRPRSEGFTLRMLGRSTPAAPTAPRHPR